MHPRCGRCTYMAHVTISIMSWAVETNWLSPTSPCMFPLQFIAQSQNLTGRIRLNEYTVLGVVCKLAAGSPSMYHRDRLWTVQSDHRKELCNASEHSYDSCKPVSRNGLPRANGGVWTLVSIYSVHTVSAPTWTLKQKIDEGEELDTGCEDSHSL